MPKDGDHDDKSSVSNAKEETVHAVVSGRVQGVGFRFFVVREGRRLGLRGMVRNLPDGRVEVFAAGAAAALRDLLDLLRRGPMLGNVEGVDVKWGGQAPQVAEFTIGY